MGLTFGPSGVVPNFAGNINSARQHRCRDGLVGSQAAT